jgi:hypothetical protein
MMDALPPQIEQLVIQARALYVSHYVEFLGSFRGKEIVTEAVMLGKNGLPVGTGALDLPTRADVREISGGFTMIPSGQYLEFKPLKFQLSGATVQLAPFMWDQIEVAANIPPNQQVLDLLTRWFKGAFKEEIEFGKGQALGCIHYMSSPQAYPVGLRFELDLGTADASVFAEMLQALINAGATEIQLLSDGAAE